MSDWANYWGGAPPQGHPQPPREGRQRTHQRREPFGAPCGGADGCQTCGGLHCRRDHVYHYQSGVVTDQSGPGKTLISGHLLHISAIDTVGDPGDPVTFQIGDGTPVTVPTGGAFSSDHFGWTWTCGTVEVIFRGGVSGAIWFVSWET